MKKRRVVVTGIGTINPLGNNVDEYWTHSLQGLSGITRNCKFSVPENLSQVNGFIRGWKELDGRLEPRERDLDPAVKMAILATNEALEGSKLNSYLLRKYQSGINIASAVGNIETSENVFRLISQNGWKLPISEKKKIDQFRQALNFNSITDILAKKYGINGECFVTATGCAGGLDAIGSAYETIKFGHANIMISGSSEAPITPLTVASFGKINATTNKFNVDPSEASRPFDANRSGFVLGEGGGIVILEELNHAKARNAPILGEVFGYSSCNSGYHMTDIAKDGKAIARSMRKAIFDAGISTDQIDVVNLHGSSTKQNDIAERNAMELVFHENHSRIPVTSNKSQIGHSLSASNSIEIISCIKTLQTRIIAPTINILHLDNAIDLNVIQQPQKLTKVDYILKDSSGFSGIHSSIVIGKLLKEI